MKRLTCLILALLLALALAAPAMADAVSLPPDSFLEKHQQECSYENRMYYANGPAGYVAAYKDPKSRATGTVPNGEMLWVDLTYDNGAWGYGESDIFSGWVKMDDLTPDYDSIAFRADHAAELVEEERSFRPDENRGDAVYAYKYPGSGVVKETMDWDLLWNNDMSFSQVFTDPAGRDWGWCGYHYGHRDFWVCLDDPYNGALPADANYVDVPSTLTPRADAATLEAAVKTSRAPNAWLIGGVGGVVVVAAAILTAAIKEKKKQA